MPKILLAIILISCMLIASSCALFRQPLDGMTGFSEYLQEVEKGVRNEDWTRAAAGLKKATKAWRQMKPFLQVDIDHDYVNDIEADFIRLQGNIETLEKTQFPGVYIIDSGQLEEYRLNVTIMVNSLWLSLLRKRE